MITLIVPPSPFLINDRVFVSLGTLYIAAVLEKAGRDVKVLDLTGKEDWEQKLRKAAKEDNELFGVTSTTADFPTAVKILEIIKSVNKEAAVAIGGPHATIAPELCGMFDKVIVGDGTTGIFLALESDEKVVHGPMVKDLDELPMPARHMIDINSYKYEINGRKATNLITQLGCPFNCAFCCGRNIKEYRTVRFRSPENVMKELDHLNEKYGFEAFMVHDDEFNLNKERTLKLCEELSKRNYIFRGFVRADLFDEETAEAMAKAGFYQVDVGVESGSPKILKIINKMTTPEMNAKARALAKKHGILFKCFITVGHPGETREDIMMTKQWLIDNKPDAFEIYVITPYPGSPLYDNRENYDIQFSIDYLKDITSVTRKDGEHRCLVRNSHLSSEEIAKLRDEVDSEVREKLGLLTAQQVTEKTGGGSAA